jgi:hypothetical protein
VKRGRGRPKKVTQEAQQAFVPPTTEAVQDGTLPADIDPTGEAEQEEPANPAAGAFDLI